MRPNFKLVPDFIIPHLERATYGRHLIWEDKKTGSFKVSRIHQNSEHWSDDCIAVYKAWSLKKKLWKMDDPKRVTKAKHRLITALRRNPLVEMLNKESAYYRFRFIHLNSPGNKISVRDSKDELFPSFGISGPLLKAENMKELNVDIFPMELTDENSPKEVIADCTNKMVIKAENSETLFSITSTEVANEWNDEITPALTEMDFIQERSPWFSDKCCCDILLDCTLLCNERCIWHGFTN